MDHINLLEMHVVFLVLRHFLLVLTGRHVLVTALGQHLDGFQSESPRGHEVRGLATARSRYPYLVPPMVCITKVVYLPGIASQAADALSRNWLHPGEWRLHLDVVQDIFCRNSVLRKL